MTTTASSRRERTTPERLAPTRTVLNGANAVTAVRVLATPVLVVLIVRNGPSMLNAVLWTLLAVSDFLDGWLARRHGPTTSGAFLDPLADKILVIGALAALAAGAWVMWLPVGLLAGRELLISAYRVWLSRRGVSVPARPLGKLKTAVEDVAVLLVLVPAIGYHHLWIGQDLLWAAVVLALVSGGQYLFDARYRRAARPAAVVDLPQGRSDRVAS